MNDAFDASYGTFDGAHVAQIRRDENFRRGEIGWRRKIG
jgi:hypothetical protein